MTTSALNTFLTPVDAGGKPAVGLRPCPNHTDQATLGNVGAIGTILTPAGADCVLFSWSAGNIQVKPYHGTAPGSVPSGNVNDGSAWEFNPGGYELRNLPGDVTVDGFAIVSDTAGCVVTASFYCFARVK